MTRVDEFNSFYSSTFSEAVRVTYAVCGDRQVAFESTVDAYRRAWRDWSKIRDRHPLGYVRNEAWKLTALSRSTHPLRRKHEQDSDTQLLDALGELSVDDRRLIVLMTLGNTDLEEASREVGVPAEQGIESVTNALGSLERAMSQTIDQIERRMHSLGAATDTFERPLPATVRTAAKRGRQRNTILLVLAAIALIIAGGFVVTDGDALASRSSLPYREKIGAERSDNVLLSQKIDTGNLLTTAQVNRLDQTRRWEVGSTDQDVNNTKPYATCPVKRFADSNPLKVLVRTYSANGAGHETVAQSIEVSHSNSTASSAYRRLVQWYSDCQHPRVQLVASYVVRRPFGDFQILRLRSHSTPERTFTVGFSHSGTVTSTLVHEVDGAKGPAITTFARTLNNSVSRVCADSGGNCTNTIRVTRTEPPATSKDPSFLGIVDLPPIADIDKVWVGVAAFSAAKKNPAATVCDKADFSGERRAKAKVFVIPQAKELPKEFGVAETVAHFASAKVAKRFVSTITARVKDCGGQRISAHIDQASTFKTSAYSGNSWRIGLEITKGSRIYYRMSIVRREADVAQVTFIPAKGFDTTSREFAAVAARAGSRLRYMGQ
jgi:DNA-directed RNA polymerase specialized sigma24 family protein